MIIWMPYSLFDKLSSTRSSSTLLLQSHAVVIHVAEISQALLDSSLSTVLKLVYTLTGNFIWYIKLPVRSLQAVEHNCSTACYANT